MYPSESRVLRVWERGNRLTPEFIAWQTHLISAYWDTPNRAATHDERTTEGGNEVGDGGRVLPNLPSGGARRVCSRGGAGGGGGGGGSSLRMRGGVRHASRDSRTQTLARISSARMFLQILRDGL